jgi:hypothetical protein
MLGILLEDAAWLAADAIMALLALIGILAWWRWR